MDLNGPIALGKSTNIVAIAFAYDLELAPVDSPNGRVEFLQVVGLTSDEFRAARCWNTVGFLEVLSKGNPLMITDLARDSILEDAATAATVQNRSASEGSSTGHLFTDSMTWTLEPGPLRSKGVLVTMGANAARQVSDILPGRVPHGRPLSLGSGKQIITFEPGNSPSWSADDGDHLRIRLSGDVAYELARSLGTGVGDYDVPELPDVHFTVRLSKIKDGGGRVVREVP